MIRVTTAGESHGPCLTVIVEGLPAGLALNADLVRADLARRQIALGAGGRMAIETDRAEITAGVMAGVTTGAPVAMTIVNANHEAWKGKSVAAYTAPRPGHADFAAVVKYGYDDIRPALERASARETASMTGEVETIGQFLKGGTPEAEMYIEQARKAGDTLGGVIAVTAKGVPVGLGSHVSADRRLDARLAAAVMSIPAIKGVEIGGGFKLDRDAGGVTGGISNGEPVTMRAAMKPIPTTLRPQATVDLATGAPCETTYERSDVCPVPRAVVVVEAAVCTVLADALMEKLGGDSLEEMKPRFAALPKTRRLSGNPTIFWPAH